MIIPQNSCRASIAAHNVVRPPGWSPSQTGISSDDSFLSLHNPSCGSHLKYYDRSNHNENEWYGVLESTT